MGDFGGGQYQRHTGGVGKRVVGALVKERRVTGHSICGTGRREGRVLRRICIWVRNTEYFTTKSKRERTVPLHPKLADLLALRVQVDHSPFVLLRSDMKQVDTGTANKKFKGYCDLAGVNSER